MLPTNKTIEIYRKSRDRYGAETKEFVGNFDVWWEPSEVIRWMPGETAVGKGTVFLFDEVSELFRCCLLIDSEYFDVVSIDRFFNQNGSFHHAECVYK